MNSKSENAVLELKVRANAGSFGIEKYSTETRILKLRVKSKPLQGKANAEICKELKRIFNSECKILQGEKSNNKKVLFTEITLNELRKKLADFESN